jgi:hypothetical protein
MNWARDLPNKFKALLIEETDEPPSEEEPPGMAMVLDGSDRYLFSFFLRTIERYGRYQMGQRRNSGLLAAYVFCDGN